MPTYYSKVQELKSAIGYATAVKLKPNYNGAPKSNLIKAYKAQHSGILQKDGSKYARNFKPERANLAVVLGATLVFCLAHYGFRADNLERFFKKYDVPSRQANAYFSSVARGFILGGAGIVYTLYAGISLDYLNLSLISFFKSLGWALAVMVVFFRSFGRQRKNLKYKNAIPGGTWR